MSRNEKSDAGVLWRRLGKIDTLGVGLDDPFGKVRVEAMTRAESPRCVDCGAESPPTDTNYTLISQRHGWRLTFSVDASGRRLSEWRCPACWVKHRQPKPGR